MARKKTENLPFDSTEFQQGRDAARASISRGEAPWAEDSDQFSDWLAGYDFEKPNVNVATDDAATAGGQIGTASDAKKG
jgi:hypothetical protein